MMRIKTVARGLTERVVAKFGYELRIVGAPPRGFDNFLGFVKNRGFQPRTVFDIGVGYGTPWLYEAFPGAHFVLIEPQVQFEPVLKGICQRLDAEYHLVGVGETEQNLPLYRLPGSPTGSSFLPPSKHAEKIWGAFERSGDTMSIVRLDRYRDQAGPFLVKIDTEGFELEVLRGAGDVLAKTDLLLMEVAVIERQKGEADLIEIGTVLKENGFRLMDIPVLTQQSVSGPLLYMDVAFARTGGTADVSAN